jgi:SnoaL-like protein
MDTVAIERACERLVLDFVFFSDHQQPEALSQLFTNEGVMHRPSGDSLIGRDAIHKSYQARPAGRLTRHLCTNIRITVDSADRARGLSYALIYSAVLNQPAYAHFGIETEPRHIVGEFEDEFVRTPEGWRFAVRHARFLMHTKGVT